MSVKGLMTETSYPYKAITGRTCLYNETAVKTPFNFGRFIIPSCDDDQDCDRQKGAEALTKVEALKLAPSVCVNANKYWFDYVGGIFDLPCSCLFDFVNHCVVLSSYSPQNSTVGIINSWGTDFGENGTMRLKVDFNSTDGDQRNPCGLFNYMTYVGVTDYQP